MPVRRLLAPAAAALLVASLSTGPAAIVPAAAAAEPDAPAVTGFALGSLTPAQLDASAEGLTTVTVAAVPVTADGRRVLAPTADVARQARRAHARGLRAELLLSNYSNRLEGFDPRAAARLLGSRANIRRVATRLATYAVDGGWDGVNIDLELVRRADGDGLVRLARELQRRLPAEAQVSIDISGRTSLAGYRAGGYRLRELAEVVDVVQLMTYDEHGPTWSGPGPIGSLDWQRRCLEAALAAVPADQLDLGVAGYGYTWPREGTGRSISPRAARRMVEAAGVTAHWSRSAGEWHARLRNGTRIWWSDRRSYRLRHAIAVERGLHGLAVWRLGSADPLTRPAA